MLQVLITNVMEAKLLRLYSRSGINRAFLNTVLSVVHLYALSSVSALGDLCLYNFMRAGGERAESECERIPSTLQP